MAVDTRNKRSGALGAARPWMMRTPLADGTISAADRRHVTYSYPITEEAVSPPSQIGIVFQLPRENTNFRVYE